MFNSKLRGFLIVLTYFLSPLLNCTPATADDAQESLLTDTDGDGLISYLGFGDSITYGVGDDAEPAGGYVMRLGNLLGIAVSNKGVPGEELVGTGEFRFPRLIQSTTNDIVGIFEGANDAFNRTVVTDVRRAQQKLINVARVLNRTVLLITLPRPCCEHGALVPFTSAYSDSLRELATINEVRFADIEKAWRTTCESPFECELYNLPEGLHPNAKGYDVIAQTVAAALLGIDIFAEDGALQLEGALGLPEGTVVVKPDLQEPAKNFTPVEVRDEF